MCHVSCVMCNAARVMCQKKIYIYIYIGGASRWRICHQGGLPRLVYGNKKLPPPFDCTLHVYGIGFKNKFVIKMC